MRTPPKSSARLLCCLAITLIVFAIVASVPASAASQGSSFTTFDPSNPDPNLGGCLDGQHPNGVDCNNYFAKPDVYTNGGPATGGGALSDGCYYFTVLAPGSQNGGFVDDAPGNLSDGTAEDDFTNRIFQVSNHTIVHSGTSYTSATCGTVGGTHGVGTDPQGNFIIQLTPYDDTPNPGGVYIAAICQVNTPGASPTPASDPSQCKYDAFRIKATTCTSNCGQATQGTVSVCKFWDQNFDHFWDNNEPFIGAWRINASIPNVTGVSLDAPFKDTDNTAVDGVPGEGFGCTSFTVNFPAADSPAITVTLSEGNAPDSSAIPVSQSCDIAGQTCQTTPNATWTQSAPFDGTNVLTSEDVPVSPNQNVQADNFGNFFGQDLTVSKTATPSFTRTYAWSLVKSLVSPTGNPVEESGSSVTITYGVTATETGFQDSSWQVAGNITVTNPNAFAVSGVTITDAVDNGGTCGVTDKNKGLTEIIPAASGGTNGSLTVPYVCTYTSAPSPLSGTNTATATWDKATFGTPDGSNTGTATFDFGSTVPSTVNKTVTITDCFNGCLVNGVPTPTTLGTLTAVDTCTGATPVCTTKTYTVKQTVTITGGSCATFTNTATITGDTLNFTTPPVTVTICNENTGALTMGFWQNKNGQGIITNYCGGINGTSLHTFLTSFHPFSDETATSCSGEATYVYNVIKAAVCTSTSKTCNLMLKAQMLATALDVYFSDGVGLGGNRIGAPAAIASAGGIGTVSIDLSKICNMIDGSGGTATCSGTTSNVASLFGVTKCDTVSAMLAYQNTSDPAVDAGAVWYGQVKANQVGAKNAFDAINNTVAPLCP
jgi:hypothetical protein